MFDSRDSRIVLFDHRLNGGTAIERSKMQVT